jgi:hypothetical protein
MVHVYRHNEIGRDTAVYGVIADPIAHSLSPQVHNAAFKAAGIDAVYVPFRVPFDTLGQFVEDVPRLGIRGLSVTIPHKEAIAKFLTKVDPAVRHAVTSSSARRIGLQHRLQGGDRLPGSGARRHGPAERTQSAQG